jgi:hypothetical protein
MTTDHSLLTTLLLPLFLQIFLNSLSAFSERGHEVLWIFIKMIGQRIQVSEEAIQVDIEGILRHEFARRSFPIVESREGLIEFAE